MSDCIQLGGVQAFLAVGIGAIVGACLRVRFILLLNVIFSITYFPTLLVNLFACFLLGVIYGLQNTNHSYSSCSASSLFLLTGFLGSLSTFSTFIFELYQAIDDKKFGESLSLLFASLVGGLIAIRIGYLVIYASVD